MRPIPLATVVVAVSCVCGTSPIVHAQCDYDLTVYRTSELLGYGSVHAMVEFDEGNGPQLIAGGVELVLYPGESSIYTASVARFDAATKTWMPMGSVLTNQYVSSLCVHENTLYAGASLGSKVYRWSGNEWIPISDGPSGGVNDLIVFDDDSGTGPALFVAAGNQLFKLVEDTWQSVAQFNQIVRDLALWQNTLVAGGAFTTVNEFPANRVAQWDGKQWSSLGSGVKNGTVGDMVAFEFADVHALVASGYFTSAGGVGVPHLAYWDGSDWHQLPETGVSDLYSMGTMAVWDNGNGPSLYIAAQQQFPDSGDSRDALLRLDTSTTPFQWQGVTTSYLIPHSFISCMTEFHDGTSKFSTLYIGGRFARLGDQDIINLGRLTPAPGNTIEPLPSDPMALKGNISSLAAFDEGDGPAVFAGGTFKDMGYSPQATLVARFQGDSWTSIGRTVFSGGIQQLQTLDVGIGPALYAAGSFDGIAPYAGSIPQRVAKWDGESWMRVGNLGTTAHALCVHDDGNGPLIYAGYQTNSFTQLVGSVARYNPATDMWTVVDSGVSEGGTFGPIVRAAVSFDDGSGPALFVAGRFNFAGGLPAQNIAKWSGYGKGWSSVGGGIVGEVFALHVHDDGSGPKLIATGSISQADNLPVHHVAEWNGKLWAAIGNLKSVGFINPSVRGVTTFDDGSGPALIVSNGMRTARWNGVNWSLLPNHGATTLLPLGDTLYMNEPFAMWSPGGNELDIIEQSTGGSFQPNMSVTLEVEVAHGGAVMYQWFRNNISIQNGGHYSGANSNRLWIGNINGSHEGSYHVVATNDCTSVTSLPIVVDVIGTCPGDVTADANINQYDVLAVLAAWGACEGNSACPADLSHDRIVNANDLLAVINAWGPCP